MSNDIMDFSIPLDLSSDEIQPWDGTGGDPLPQGYYTVEIIDAKQETAKSSGNPMLTVQFQVVDEGEHQGRKIYSRYTLKQDPKTLARVKQLLLACGASLNAINRSDLVGAQLEVEVYHQQMPATNDAMGNPVAGKVSMSVRGERPLSQPEPAPAPTPAAVAAKAKAATPAKNGAVAARR